MNTPIWDFVNRYAQSDTLRLHMPGHKGSGPIGAERFDITEVVGADALYEASGIIAESEANASVLFGSARTVYSAEGSSQCIRAMVYLAKMAWQERGGAGGRSEGDSGGAGPEGCGRRPGCAVMAAARNVHRSFVYACALADVDVEWIDPEAEEDERPGACGRARGSLLSCPIDPGVLERTLGSLCAPCCGVYVTSPDYTGRMQDIAGLSAVCRRFGVPLLVDNAHGAYLHFLPEPMHPLDLGADLCCDSAHKTLPVLTGGAYLHVGAAAPAVFGTYAKAAMALHGSTSPSYLILSSLDACNGCLDGQLKRDLSAALPALSDLRKTLRDAGWEITESDPLHLTIAGNGKEIGEMLRACGIEPEYTGPDGAVLLFDAAHAPADAKRVAAALERPAPAADAPAVPRAPASPSASQQLFGYAPAPGPLAPAAPPRPARVCTIREAVFAPQETIPSAAAAGRIAAAPTASCPPAIPPVMPGEVITDAAIALLLRYGITQVSVIRES